MNDTRHVNIENAESAEVQNFEYNDDLYKSIEEAEILTCTRCNKNIYETRIVGSLIHR